LVLVKKSLAALAQSGLGRLVVAGGVGANRHLRQQLNQACQRRGVRVHYPELHLCTDNGAMIANVGRLRLLAGLPTGPTSARPRWQVGEA
jgi:N6-L-threonylcarbamoyladenine synthase